MEYLATLVPVMEQYSIDEIFGDLSGWVEKDETEDFVIRLQKQITKTFNLPVSIGAAKSKWIAKLATSTAKPYGTRVVRKEHIKEFVKNISIKVSRCR